MFGTVTAGWDNTYYIDASLRNDWNSTLPADKNSYLYGGLSVSAVTSNWIKNAPWLSYWKLRGSMAQVGSALNPYQLSDIYYFGKRYNSTASLYGSPTLIDRDIKPAITKSYEVGTEFSLFGERIFGDINEDPNNPTTPYTSLLFSNAARHTPYIWDDEGYGSNRFTAFADPICLIYQQYIAENKDSQFSLMNLFSQNMSDTYRYVLRNLNDIVRLTAAQLLHNSKRRTRYKAPTARTHASGGTQNNKRQLVYKKDFTLIIADFQLFAVTLQRFWLRHPIFATNKHAAEAIISRRLTRNNIKQRNKK